MAYKNFLISGSGRTGTRFLSSVMNRSEKWTVLHEPHPKGIDKNTLETLPEIQEIFNKNYYGEVNSMRRLLLSYINVAKKGILIRNPHEVWISIANRKFVVLPKRINAGMRVRVYPDVKPKITQWVEEFKESLHITSDAIKSGIHCIYFHKMTTDTNYLKDTLKYFDIHDVELTEDIIETKIGATPTKCQYKNFEDTPGKEIVKSYCEEFFNEHLKGI